MLLHTALLLHYTFEGGRRQTTEGFAVRDRDRDRCDENERVRAKTVVVAGEGSSFPGAVGGRGRAGVWEREEEQPKESERNAHVMLGRYARIRRVAPLLLRISNSNLFTPCEGKSVEG